MKDTDKITISTPLGSETITISEMKLRGLGLPMRSEIERLISALITKGVITQSDLDKEPFR